MGQLTHNAKGNKNFIKEKFLKGRALGERANASHFSMKVKGYPGLDYRIASTQLPALERELIESYGPMGTNSNYQGNLKNAGELTVVIEETIDAKAMKDLIDIIDNKKYVDIEVAMTPEDTSGAPSMTAKLSECSLACEAADLANESVTEFVKVSVTFRYNWVERV